MNRIWTSIIVALTAILAFLAGMFTRQPKINKLKKQITILNSDNTALLLSYQQTLDEFDNLLIQHKALKAIELVKKRASNEKIKENLILQYSLFEYLELLLARVKNKQKLNKEQISFLQSYEKIINGKQLSSSDMGKVKNYILEKYMEEIDNRTVCDCSSMFQEISEYTDKKGAN